MLDACHALLSIATLTDCMLFDNLLRSVRSVVWARLIFVYFFGLSKLLMTWGLSCKISSWLPNWPFSFRPFGTLRVLATLTCEVVKAYTASADEDDRWSSEALDILLEAWGVVLGVQSWILITILTYSWMDIAWSMHLYASNYLYLPKEWSQIIHEFVSIPLKC